MAKFSSSKPKFVAYTVALDLIRALRPLVEKIARHDRGLATQIREAGSSIVLNLAEGNRRVGRDRTHFFRVAAGSADEVGGGIDTAVCWGYVEESETTDARAILDRLLGLMWGLTRTHRAA